jgi:hypothetical protein
MTNSVVAKRAVFVLAEIVVAEVLGVAVILAEVWGMEVRLTARHYGFGIW